VTDEQTDQYEPLRKAHTSAGNYDLDTDAIIAHLKEWESLCTFRVAAARHDTVEIEFETFPEDMDAFASDLYSFCPDLVDQGTGCVHEVIEMMQEAGKKPSEKMQKMIEGVDFEDEDYGLEILKRELLHDKRVKLWWD
jgi:Domain of unknown function (DUF4253)